MNDSFYYDSLSTVSMESIERMKNPLKFMRKMDCVLDMTGERDESVRTL